MIIESDSENVYLGVSEREKIRETVQKGDIVYTRINLKKSLWKGDFLSVMICLAQKISRFIFGESSKYSSYVHPGIVVEVTDQKVLVAEISFRSKNDRVFRVIDIISDENTWIDDSYTYEILRIKDCAEKISSVVAGAMKYGEEHRTNFYSYYKAFKSLLFSLKNPHMSKEKIFERIALMHLNQGFKERATLFCSHFIAILLHQAALELHSKEILSWEGVLEELEKIGKSSNSEKRAAAIKEWAKEAEVKYGSKLDELIKRDPDLALSSKKMSPQSFLRYLDPRVLHVCTIG